jgi:hypothetical protein
MGWRFRRSIKIVPGVSVNLGKRGFSSISVGVRGLRTTVGRRGVTKTVGIPGTGLSFTSRGSRSRYTQETRTRVAVPLSPTRPAIDPSRFGIEPEQPSSSAGRARILALGLAAVALALAALLLRVEWLWAAGSLLILGLVLPSRATFERRATERASQQAAQELERRSTLFRAALTEPGASVAKILDLQKRLGLTDEEIGSSTALALSSGLEQERFVAQVASSGLPVLSGHERFVGASRCSFVGHVRYDKRGSNDPDGTLYLTDEEAVFYAEGAGGRVAAPWSKTVSVSREGSTLGIQRRDRQTPLLFDCASLGDALRAEFISRRFLETPAVEPDVLVSKTAGPRSSVAATADDAPVGTTVELPGTGRFTVSIVGESHHQLTLQALAGDKRRQDEEVIFTAALIPELTNPYDPNAVKIYAKGAGHVGYLSRDDAAAFRPVSQFLDKQHAAGLCRARLVGGTDDKPSIGVILDLKDVTDILAELPVDPQPF